MNAPDPIEIIRKPIMVRPDPSRVITRPFVPDGQHRIESVVQRILDLSEEEAAATLEEVMESFADRHIDLVASLEDHFLRACHAACDGMELSTSRRLLLGAYFTSEYSIESVALFNPSIVPHPDQEGTDEGDCRFILSLRATGEQHISSIAFRSGVIHADGEIELHEVSPYVIAARPVPDARYIKPVFAAKLTEIGVYRELVSAILDPLPEEFTYDELERTCAALEYEGSPADLLYATVDTVLWLARSNYHVSFAHRRPVCEQVIFPVSEVESRGIEDARFTLFDGGDGSRTYYATYTAYNGFRTLPMLINTSDFHTFNMSTLNGTCVRNKGMALFPRRVNGRYMMLSRLDGENLFLMNSDNLHFWNEARELIAPGAPWEFMQIGNCGSPLETEKGWLVLTHGVGPMRTYCISASLLDLDDPSQVIGQLSRPLITPTREQRDGYVPNVVYTCGALLHNGLLVVPYAVSDTMTTFVTVALDELWAHFRV